MLVIVDNAGDRYKLLLLLMQKQVHIAIFSLNQISIKLNNLGVEIIAFVNDFVIVKLLLVDNDEQISFSILHSYFNLRESYFLI